MVNSHQSRNLAARPRVSGFSVLILLAGLLATIVTQAADRTSTNTPGAIPWNEIGAKAGANYQGNGLAVTPTESGARLHCVFQRLDGEATPEGLWLTSTVTNTVNDPSSVAALRRVDRFSVTATEVSRTAACASFNFPFPESSILLPDAGEVSVCGQTVRFSRPGLTEEYSVSMDGVRQDFIVEFPPGRGERCEPLNSCPSPISPFPKTSSQPAGELVVKLAVAGAQVEAAADGARLVLTHSGRTLAYSRLRVTDATGRELPARMEVGSIGAEVTGLDSLDPFGDEVADQSLLTSAATSGGLAVVVNDAAAVYPVRIDPTFSDANWVSMGGLPGVNGQVYAAVTDGSGNLYIGGSFANAGGSPANNIAEWNGSSWSAFGSGISGSDDGGAPYVYALAVSGSTLFAGGYFTTAGGSAANNIAEWNGTSWSALGSGMNEDGSVYALAVSGSTLFAGGYFTTAGGSAANSIAQWNGSSWSALGSGMNEYGYVYALAVSGSTLYAVGQFATAGGTAANDIAQWNGSSWSPLGSGISGGYVSALAVSGSTLYAGGHFTTAGGSAANSIARWNGTSWSALGSGTDGEVEALAVSGSTLYAGGQFTTVGGSGANDIAQWNGSSWSAFGSGISDEGPDGGLYVHALAVSGGTLYAGGDFTMAGGSTANSIAQWNGSSWSALDSGFDGPVSALAVSGSTLYVGGDFTTVGGSAATNIVQWNGSSWSALGSGMNKEVLALAVSGVTLYAGGGFTTAGGSAANGIAQWNGSSWSPLGSGISGGDEYGTYVSALAVSGSTLYAGGDFTMAGGNAANDIAQWNGSSWSGLGSGMNGDVEALALSGGTLYAGGLFTTAGGSAANNIAQWNGSSWSALGSGMGGRYPSVYALAVSGSTLYVGGSFTNAGGSAANNIAQWNGSSWSALGLGIYGSDFSGGAPYVKALAVSGRTLYAGGGFTAAGGNAANNIAQWNGSSWSALGSGVGGIDYPLGPYEYLTPEVSALAVSGIKLYAGGGFTTAGTNVSAYVAMAYLPGSLAIITTNAVFGFTGGAFGFDVSGPSGANVVIQASTDLHTWIPLQTNLLGSGPLYFSDPQSTTNAQRYYRVQLLP